MEVQGKTRGQRWNCFWKQPRLARSHNLGHGEAHGGNKANTRKSKHASIVEAHESTRKRLEITLPKDHEDRIAGKSSFLRVITILCTSSFLWTEQ